MSEYNKPILVTWDFSKKAEEALLHALNYSNFTNTDVALLNIVKKEKDVDEATKKLEAKIEEIKSEHGKNVHAIVKVGNIFFGAYIKRRRFLIMKWTERKVPVPSLLDLCIIGYNPDQARPS